MKVLEHGGRIGRTLLFFPCTAEPVWVFEQTIALLAQRWHVFQVVFDGHEPEEPGDFTSVEQTVDEVTEYLKAHGVARLDAAYGCSLGGACLTRFLALGEIPVGRAIIDGGITPYQLPYLLRKLILARDVLSFKLAANDRKVLEAAFPPERFTIPGHDPVKEYDAMEPYDTRVILGMRLVWRFWKSKKDAVTATGDHIDAFLRLPRRSTRNVEQSEKGAGSACAQEHRAFSASRKSAVAQHFHRNPERGSFA